VQVVGIIFGSDGSFSAVYKRIKEQAVTEFLIELHWQLLAFYGEGTVDISTLC
jgi:hypothetical protein